MPIQPDSTLEATVSSLASRLLVEESEDFPVVQPGFVRTFLFPCAHYKLPGDRLFALRDMMMSRGSHRFFLKRQQKPGWTYIYNGTAPHPLPFPGTDALLAFQAELQRGEEIPGFDRVPTELWFEGDWSRDVDEEFRGIEGDDEVVQEHMLLDGAGTWALLFSDEDHAYLVSDPSTSRAILSMWGTSQDDELHAYEAYLSDARSDGYAERLLDHAHAGRWS